MWDVKLWHAPESKIAEPYFSSEGWVERVGMLGGNVATEQGMLGENSWCWVETEHCEQILRSGNNPDRGTSTDRGTAPDRGALYLDRQRLIRIKVASGKHLFLWYNSNCDWQRCIGITMTIWAIFITPVTPFPFMGLSLTTWQSGCPFQKEWKPYISRHIFNLMATSDDK